MKIGIDVRLWNETGVGRYIQNLVKNLAQIDKSNDYTLFVRSKDYKDVKFQISNFRFQIVNTDIQWHTINEQVRFPLLLQKQKLDLVHFPYFSVPIFYPGRFVVTIHDLILNHFDTGAATTLPLLMYKLKRIGYKFVISQAAKKASKIIAVSHATKEEIIKHLKVDSDKVAVTYEGVDDNLNSKVKSEKSKIQLKSQNFFLYVGNAYPHKNLGRLLEAFAKVIKKNPSIKLVFAGKRDYFYAKLGRKVIDMNLSDHVLFYQKVDDDLLASLYTHAKATVIPSLMEGFGLPALEAMANKCLVLAADIPALRETCSDAAIYFNPYDVDDLIEKLKDVTNQFKSTVYRTKREKGIARVKMFSWEQMAKETVKIYEEAGGS